MYNSRLSKYLNRQERKEKWKERDSFKNNFMEEMVPELNLGCPKHVSNKFG
jgi:hypothetical protein